MSLGKLNPANSMSMHICIYMTCHSSWLVAGQECRDLISQHAPTWKKGISVAQHKKVKGRMGKK